MSGAINVGLSGLAGWRVLQRSEDRQLEAIAKDAIVQRSISYFRDRIEVTDSAEKLVGDYRMLSVALSAFGLENDIGSRAFIRKILESDLSDTKSLVNRLSDKRYLRLAQAFDFSGQNNTDEASFGDRISEAYVQREFERRVGQTDETLRLALNARRELESFAERTSSNKTLWYEVLGNPPLRKVFEGAFGFGSAYGKLPIDRQVEEFTKASERLLGTSALSEISTSKSMDRLINTFVARAQISEASANNRYSAALTLLSGR